MVRNYCYSALVLRARPSGDANREITFLTAEEGLIRATVFGGPKSRLRAHTAPFHRGRLWIYRDPAKDFMKVTDFDVQTWRPGIRELYERTMAASAVAETVLAAQGGGGGWREALSLTDGALDALEGADAPACRRLIIQFLWDWAEILGQRPELNRCASCACEAREDGLLWYSLRDGTMVCPDCAALPAGAALPAAYTGYDGRGGAPGWETAGYLPAGPGVRRWLAAVQAPARPRRLTLDRAAEREAKALVTAILAGALGRRLPTWEF